MLKNIFPKKSVLNKNKWLLLAIVVLVCVGLYWYSRKNRENFKRSTIGGYNTIVDNFEINRELYNNIATDEKGEKIIIENNDDVRFEKLNNELIEVESAKRIYIDGIKQSCTLNEKWTKGPDQTMAEPNVNVVKSMINNRWFEHFFMGMFVDDVSETWSLTKGEDMFVSGDEKCIELNTKFTTLLSEIIDQDKGTNETFKEKLTRLQTANTDKKVLSDTDFVTNTMNQTLTVFVAKNCDASSDFLTEIWPGLVEFVKVGLKDQYPLMSFNVEECEEFKTDSNGNPEDGRIKDTICNLSGIFDNTKSSSVYPLIQYNYLINTQNSDKDYVLRRYTFDPTKKWDNTNKEMVNEEVDADGNPKTIYTLEKFKDWWTSFSD